MINEINIALALRTLHPTSKWVIRDDVVEWKSNDIPQPTQAEIDAEITRLQAEYDANQYQRDRATAYPSLQDQADMAYWDRKNGTTTLDDAIDAVKAAHPKPE